ncbi:MAG: glycosyltransferase family 4 protein [Candidatus Sulfotelmatobacter sp.]
MFSNTVVRGGAEEHILQLLSGLDRKQFRPSLACTPELATLLGRELPKDVEMCELRLDRLADFRGMLRLRTFLRKNRIQILHSHMFRASLFASPIGRIARVPVIVETAHVREVWRKGWKACFVVDRVASKCVDQTIAVSNAIARYLIESKGIAKHKITVIPTAPALCAPAEKCASLAERKRSLGVSETDPLIVLAGRLEPQKGHKVAIDAMIAVLKEFPRAQLMFLGEGSLRSQLEQLVESKELGGNVRFGGFIKNLRDWFAAADLSVLPSFYEGLPMTVLEALQEACPIVATAVDGTPEIIRDGETGILVPPGNAAELGNAICTMLRDREFAKRTAVAGQRDVLRNFSVGNLITRTQELYLRTLDRHLQTAEAHSASPVSLSADRSAPPSYKAIGS